MSAPQRPVMFRAGRTTGPPGTMAAQLAVPRFTGPVVLLADFSEFQPDIADAAYLAWSKAAIFRAMYGTRVDRAWYGGQRRDLLHQGGVRFLGIYAYLVADQDPVAQAEALISLVGRLRPGEKIIADIEEGTGDLSVTWRIWFSIIRDALGDAPWIYSGLNFAAAHGLAPVDWVAAYGQPEPAVPHHLWQFTDAMTIPGIPGPCDCSVFHGTIDDLAALAWQPQPVPQPAEDTVIIPDLISGGPAVALPVPAGKTRLILYADPGYRGLPVPSVRVIFNTGGPPRTASPAWGAPAAVDVPPGGTRVSLARLDDGSVPVTAAFA
jgi:hypothetical protein